MFKIGDKVTYITHNKKEHGIVKSYSDATHYFVVYNCDGKWTEYFNYTGCRTCIEDLYLGWI